MPSPNLTGLLSDPDFQALAPSDQRSALQRVTGDSSFGSLSDSDFASFKQRMTPAGQSASPETQAQPDPGFFGEIVNQVKGLVSSAASQFNPSSPLVGVPGGPAMWDMAKSSAQNASSEGSQVWDALSHGNVRAAASHAISALPVVGPAITHTAENFNAGRVGAGMADLAPVALGAIAPEVMDALPSTARAGSLFDSVDAAAGKVPIDVSDPGTVAGRAKELFDRGEPQLPSVIRKFYNRVNTPGGADVSFAEARDYYSSAAQKLSPDELQKMTPRMASQLAQFKEALGRSLTDALLL